MIKGLYFITDCSLSRQGVVEDAKQVIEAGCRLVQYREKQKSTAEMLSEAKALAKICKQKHALFLVNDRVDIALASNADGVHLGLQDMPLPEARKILGKQKTIGATVHSVEEALLAEKQGADYLSVSPVFSTETKKDAGKPAGIQLVKAVKAKTRLPIVAISGISRQNLQQVIIAGAGSVAIISAILKAGSPFEEAKKIVELLGELQ